MAYNNTPTSAKQYSISGSVCIATVAAIVNSGYKNGEFVYDSNKYRQNVIPVLDILYFTKKLDAVVSEVLSEYDYKIYSNIVPKFPTPANHNGKSFITLNSVFTGQLVDGSAPSTPLQVSDYKTPCEVTPIVEAEFERNGDYLIENMQSLSGRDPIAPKVLTKEDLIKFESLDLSFIKSYYKNIGVKREKIGIDIWEDFKEETLTALYYEVVTRRNLESIISYKQFLQLVGKAIQETEQFMQIVQTPEYQEKRQR